MRTFRITVEGKTVVTGLKDSERIPTMLALRAAGHRTARAWLVVPEVDMDAQMPWTRFEDGA